MKLVMEIENKLELVPFNKSLFNWKGEASKKSKLIFSLMELLGIPRLVELRDFKAFIFRLFVLLGNHEMKSNFYLHDILFHYKTDNIHHIFQLSELPLYIGTQISTHFQHMDGNLWKEMTQDFLYRFENKCDFNFSNIGSKLFEINYYNEDSLEKYLPNIDLDHINDCKTLANCALNIIKKELLFKQKNSIDLSLLIEKLKAKHNIYNKNKFALKKVFDKLERQLFIQLLNSKKQIYKSDALILVYVSWLYANDLIEKKEEEHIIHELYTFDFGDFKYPFTPLNRLIEEYNLTPIIEQIKTFK